MHGSSKHTLRYIACIVANTVPDLLRSRELHASIPVYPCAAASVFPHACEPVVNLRCSTLPWRRSSTPGWPTASCTGGTRAFCARADAIASQQPRDADGSPCARMSLGHSTSQMTITTTRLETKTCQCTTIRSWFLAPTTQRFRTSWFSSPGSIISKLTVSGNALAPS